MLRNMLLASLGNLARNRLYAAINIGGLAIALAAAILIGLFVRDDLTFDHFIPGYADVYRLSITLGTPQDAPLPLPEARTDLAALFKADFPQVQSIARMAPTQPIVRRGRVEAVETVYSADPAIFEVLPLPVYAGDLKAALSRPDGLVLTRRMARKYFGREDVIGQTLDLDISLGPPATQTHRVMVAAVLQDLPGNTHLNSEIFISGLAPFSALAFADQAPKGFGPRAYTYVRLAPGASAVPLIAAMPGFGQRHIDPRPLSGGHMTVDLKPLTAIHFLRPEYSEMKPPGNRNATLAIAVIGGLIVLMAAINFVSLMTARAGRRALEVGVRKAVGASRGHITLQFLGEAVGYSLIALTLAIALSELMSPLAGSIVGQPIRLQPLQEPALLLALGGFALVLGVLAGLYPALVMASFRAASVLKGGLARAPGGGGLRQGLAVVQFAILIGLVISALVIWRQTAFALAKGLDHGGDRILLVSQHPDCLLLRDRVRRLPGVAKAGCATAVAVTGEYAPTEVTTASGRTGELDMAPLDFGVMEMHGFEPLAGRFLSQAHPLDGVLLPGPSADKQPSVVINVTAARKLGFASPAEAVGKAIRWMRLNPRRTGAGDSLYPARASQIVGVVPDFSMQSVRDAIRPTLYYVDPDTTRSGFLAVELTGENVAATLRAIAQQAPAMGARRPFVLRFYSQIAQALYADIVQQTAAVSASAGLAVLIASLGLFGLAAFTAERRIKEIGVRKAMGAATSDIVGLLLKAFTRPVLLANLLAWPVAWWAMDRWLAGFAYHVDLSPWYFVAGGGAAALIAVLTVLGHCIHQARARPVQALRYE
jgi:putative ABC transport system permease protein